MVAVAPPGIFCVAIATRLLPELRAGLLWRGTTTDACALCMVSAVAASARATTRAPTRLLLVRNGQSFRSGAVRWKRELVRRVRRQTGRVRLERVRSRF